MRMLCGPVTVCRSYRGQQASPRQTVTASGVVFRSGPAKRAAGSRPRLAAVAERRPLCSARSLVPARAAAALSSRYAGRLTQWKLPGSRLRSWRSRPACRRSSPTWSSPQHLFLRGPASRSPRCCKCRPAANADYAAMQPIANPRWPHEPANGRDDDRRRSEARAYPMPDGHAFLADARDQAGRDHHASVAGR